MKEYIAGNKLAWEEAYDKALPEYRSYVDTIKATPYACLDELMRLDVEKMDLRGKSIAQFCCNNGREINSMGYHGGAAAVYGFDIAQNMIDSGAESARGLGLEGEFVCGDVCEVPERFNGKFDAVFFTAGALCWFERVSEPISAAVRCLKPGGFIYIFDQHPVTLMFSYPGEEDFDENEPSKLVFSYFRREPFVEGGGMFYLTGRNYDSKEFTSYNYTVSDLINSAANSGLTVRRFDEHQIDICCNCPSLENKGIPLSFTLVASKPL